MDAELEIRRLQRRVQELEQENAELRAQLAAFGLSSSAQGKAGDTVFSAAQMPSNTAATLDAPAPIRSRPLTTVKAYRLPDPPHCLSPAPVLPRKDPSLSFPVSRPHRCLRPALAQRKGAEERLQSRLRKRMAARPVRKRARSLRQMSEPRAAGCAGRRTRRAAAGRCRHRQICRGGR